MPNPWDTGTWERSPLGEDTRRRWRFCHQTLLLGRHFVFPGLLTSHNYSNLDPVVWHRILNSNLLADSQLVQYKWHLSNCSFWRGTLGELGHKNGGVGHTVSGWESGLMERGWFEVQGDAHNVSIVCVLQDEALDKFDRCFIVVTGLGVVWWGHHIVHTPALQEFPEFGTVKWWASVGS